MRHFDSGAGADACSQLRCKTRGIALQLCWMLTMRTADMLARIAATERQSRNVCCCHECQSLAAWHQGHSSKRGACVVLLSEANRQLFERMVSHVCVLREARKLGQRRSKLAFSCGQVACHRFELRPSDGQRMLGTFKAGACARSYLKAFAGACWCGRTSCSAPEAEVSNLGGFGHR